MSVIDNFKIAHYVLALPIPGRNGEKLKCSHLWGRELSRGYKRWGKE
jgi:hypothetical protein